MKLPTIVASCCFLLSHTAFAQVEVSEIPAIDANGEMCTDVAPFDDNFGWNGTCSCDLDQDYRRFGWSIAASDNLLIAGSLQTPEGCFESGAASVYEIEDGEPPRKIAELQSSARVSGDGFSTSQSKMAISGDYVALSTRSPLGTDPAVTVFDRNTWEEAYVLRSSTTDDYGTRFWFGNHLEIIDDSLFIGETATIFRYRLSDGSLEQTIPHDPIYSCLSSVSASGSSLVVVKSACTTAGGDNQISIYEPDASDQYRSVFSTTEQRIGIPQTTDDVVVSKAFGRSFHRSVEGEWSDFPLPIDPSTYELYLADEQLVYLGGDNILFHEFSRSGWELAQTLPYSFEAEPFDLRASFDGNTFAIVSSNDSETSENYSNDDGGYKHLSPEILIFQRNSERQWDMTDQRSFPVSSTVTDGPITDAVAIVGDNAFFSMHEGQSMLHYQLPSNDTQGNDANNGETNGSGIDTNNSADNTPSDTDPNSVLTPDNDETSSSAENAGPEQNTAENTNVTNGSVSPEDQDNSSATDAGNSDIDTSGSDITDAENTNSTVDSSLLDNQGASNSTETSTNSGGGVFSGLLLLIFFPLLRRGRRSLASAHF